MEKKIKCFHVDLYILKYDRKFQYFVVVDVDRGLLNSVTCTGNKQSVTLSTASLTCVRPDYQI